jgi:hypothetical protein
MATHLARRRTRLPLWSPIQFLQHCSRLGYGQSDFDALGNVLKLDSPTRSISSGRLFFPSPTSAPTLFIW